MLKLTTDKHEASRSLSATSELLVYDTVSLTSGRRCSGVRYGILYDLLFSYQRATIQRPWRSSLRSPSTVLLILYFTKLCILLCDYLR